MKINYTLMERNFPKCAKILRQIEDYDIVQRDPLASFLDLFAYFEVDEPTIVENFRKIETIQAPCEAETKLIFGSENIKFKTVCTWAAKTVSSLQKIDGLPELKGFAYKNLSDQVAEARKQKVRAILAPLKHERKIEEAIDLSEADPFVLKALHTAIEKDDVHFAAQLVGALVDNDTSLIAIAETIRDIALSNNYPPANMSPEDIYQEVVQSFEAEPLEMKERALLVHFTEWIDKNNVHISAYKPEAIVENYFNRKD